MKPAPGNRSFPAPQEPRHCPSRGHHLTPSKGNHSPDLHKDRALPGFEVYTKWNHSVGRVSSAVTLALDTHLRSSMLTILESSVCIRQILD